MIRQLQFKEFRAAKRITGPEYRRRKFDIRNKILSRFTLNYWRVNPQKMNKNRQSDRIADLNFAIDKCVVYPGKREDCADASNRDRHNHDAANSRAQSSLKHGHDVHRWNALRSPKGMYIQRNRNERVPKCLENDLHILRSRINH